MEPALFKTREEPVQISCGLRIVVQQQHVARVGAAAMSCFRRKAAYALGFVLKDDNMLS